MRFARRAQSTSCLAPMSSSPTSSRESWSASPAIASRPTTPVARPATGTAPASSSSTGRSTARSRGRRPSAARGDGPPRRDVRGDRRRPSARRGSGRHAERPYVLLTQPSLFDDSRAPAGKHTAWAYCHVPYGSAERHDRPHRGAGRALRAGLPRPHPRAQRDRAGRLRARATATSSAATSTAARWTSPTLFRPVRRLVPYRTPAQGVYLCSSSTPPGGGVHGMCGYSAALTALADS